MKTSLIALAVLAATAMPVAADEIEDSLKLALEAYQKGDVVVAKEETDYAAQLLAQQQASALSNVLPAPFDGWSREDSEDVAMGAGMFGGGLMAGATYERDNDTVDMQIIADSPMMTAMASVFANPGMAGSMGKLRRIQGHKALETRDGELQALIHNRFLVQISGSASSADKEAYFTAIDFEAMAGF